MKKIILSLFSVFLFCAAFAQAKPEFRGVWIASVDNIDWPRRYQYAPENQKQEFIRQLDLHQRNGMNAVVVQVRPSADAFYPSPYEPWSQWLTGVQGKAPSPFYDPLEFTIAEAHKRGFEYHAWVNPYRANFSIGKASIAPDHVTRKHPEWFLKYGNTLYFDPGNKEAQDWVVAVIKDMVTRYDVDAIHMDDYFYPYRIAGKEFPDYATYLKYGNGMTRDDWRRSNTDSIIFKLTNVIHQAKPWVKFGISPFGVWRNQDRDSLGSATKAGVTNYDDLYADVLLWLEEGWIDYVAPQIYWEMSHKLAPFQPILEWWNKNANGRHVYAGIGIYRAGSNWAWKQPNQLPRQIEATRSQENVQGQLYFSSTTFDKNPYGWNDLLRKDYYREKVTVPEMPWLPKRSGSGLFIPQGGSVQRSATDSPGLRRVGEDYFN
ncbi:MAG TPA: family 10 glycosylhydrolase [Flavisolibacter sp.]|nr:family 10 glycosylhydrolase [Flavisolibacter sp.]